MPSILNLKFKGNKSFVAFSNLNDAESLTQTWKVCTKVASNLEQGQRLENLSWRLWHLQNLIVDSDNAKSRREFKKLSKCMGDKLDKEKGRSIEELSAPDFRRNHSTDMIKQRAAEKERNREAYMNAPGTIKRMQFTFSVDQPVISVSSAPVKKPDTKPSAELSKRARAARVHHEDANMTDFDTTSAKSSASDPITPHESIISSDSSQSHALRFPTLFNDSFGPSALLYAAPTLTTPMTYGEGFAPSGSADDQFRISRPTIEVPLDEILFDDESSSDDGWASAINALSAATITKFTSRNNAKESQSGSADKAPKAATAAVGNTASASAGQLQDIIMYPVAPHNNESGSNQRPVSTTPLSIVPSQYSTISTNVANDAVTRSTSHSTASSLGADDEAGSNYAEEEDDDIDQPSPAPSTAKQAIFKNLSPVSAAANEVLPETIAPSRLFSIHGARSGTPNTSRPTLTLKTQGAMTTRSSGPGASVTNLNPAILRSNGNSGPGGVKAECSNCGATHTPLWRRGLNDELNCNACGLYCKLHKRPRPKSMRSSHGESRSQTTPRPDTVEVVGTSRPRSLSTKGSSFTENQTTRPSVSAQCYNCHTTATPLWRKDDEGKTVCNACGLYYKLHGSARPISMKSDVIRKRSRHDARRASQSGFDEATSASPEISCRTSPSRESSPTLAPDSTTRMSYDFGEDANEFRNSTSSSSELAGALGSTTTNHNNNSNNESTSLFSTFPPSYPGPYHPDYLMQLCGLNSDPLPFSSVETTTETDPTMSPRSTKRRRMSTDSATEPPSSAVSYSSYNSSSISSSSSADGYTSAASTPSHHSRKSSLDFPFNPFTSNGGINQGPALRGSGNTFWHPPMMPQNQADAEPFWHPPLVPPTAHTSNVGFNISSKDASPANNSASVSTNARGRSISKSPPSNTVDTAMDFFQHGMIQDDDLFSAYLHAHDEKTCLSVENGSSTAMYVDSYF